ncbi:GGDEF domain-containing protein [Spongiibacter taiwanensis]|uniref:GGDEF domain-containing protein n=1 Tax=Spongiibacter taiwanensis TaxID=1748242 RepID=UPI0020366477|nr:GGDEF domain-containing protein [Spongiibacter taiwanensis]USA44364.1 GGDEF domain-containing protein [Spongiibacter taiwanensis]
MLNAVTKYLWVLPSLLVSALITGVIFVTSPMVDDVHFANAMLEGLLVLMPLIGTFVVINARQRIPHIYGLAMISFAFLLLSMSMDTLDELVEVEYVYTLWFEGVAQILGFVFLLLTFYKATKHTTREARNLGRLAITDELTEIFNRRYLLTHLNQEIRNVGGCAQEFAVVLIDLDHFKKINDTYGHDVGDQVLRSYAALLTAGIRKSDIAARYGGEEFVVLARHTGQRGAATLCEHLQARTREQWPEGLPPLTASMGVAIYDGRESAEAVLSRADKALYRAKHEGRDRVVFADRAAGDVIRRVDATAS